MSNYNADSVTILSPLEAIRKSEYQKLTLETSWSIIEHWPHLILTFTEAVLQELNPENVNSNNLLFREIKFFSEYATFYSSKNDPFYKAAIETSGMRGSQISALLKFKVSISNPSPVSITSFGSNRNSFVKISW